MSYDREPEKTTCELPKLKLCPNCHTPSVKVKYYPGPMKKRFSVGCTKCGVHLKLRFLTKEQAIKAWNNARG